MQKARLYVPFGRDLLRQILYEAIIQGRSIAQTVEHAVAVGFDAMDRERTHQARTRHQLRIKLLENCTDEELVAQIVDSRGYMRRYDRRGRIEPQPLPDKSNARQN